MTALLPQEGEGTPAPWPALAAARRLCHAEVAQVEACLVEALAPQPWLGDAERTLLASGKRIRALVLLLAARAWEAAGPSPTDLRRRAQAAASLELLHAASLIHDDLVDGSASRRGQPALHLARGQAVALLLGDVQLVQALRGLAAVAESLEDVRLLRDALDVGFLLCAGELDELCDSPDDTLAARQGRARRTIDRKTAGLFGLAAEMGAGLVRAPAAYREALGSFGRNFGRAFQLVDDLSELAAAGATPCEDLRQRRPTVAILAAEEALGPDSTLARWMAGELGEDGLLEAARELAASGAALSTYLLARTYATEAAGCLSTLPAGPAVDALSALLWEVVDAAPMTGSIR